MTSTHILSMLVITAPILSTLKGQLKMPDGLGLLTLTVQPKRSKAGNSSNTRGFACFLKLGVLLALRDLKAQQKL